MVQPALRRGHAAGGVRLFFRVGQPAHPEKRRRKCLRTHHAPDRCIRPLAAAAVRARWHAQHQAAGAVLAGHRLDRARPELDAVGSALPERDVHAADGGDGVPARLEVRAQPARRVCRRPHLSGVFQHLPLRPALSHQRARNLLVVPAVFPAAVPERNRVRLEPTATAAGRGRRHRPAIQVIRPFAAGGPGPVVVVFAPARLPSGRLHPPGRVEAACRRPDIPRAVRPVVPARPGSGRGLAGIRDEGKRRQVRPGRGVLSVQTAVGQFKRVDDDPRPAAQCRPARAAGGGADGGGLTPSPSTERGRKTAMDLVARHGHRLQPAQPTLQPLRARGHAGAGCAVRARMGAAGSRLVPRHAAAV